LNSKQFPPYFAISTVGSAFLTVSTALIAGFKSPIDVITHFNTFDGIQVGLFAFAAAGAALNYAIIGPASRNLAFERRRMIFLTLNGFL
jgi:hypothetical protein